MHKIEVYHCDYCKKYGKSKSNIKSHEKVCYHNPATKACAICANLIQKEYKVDKKSLNIDIPGDVYGCIPACVCGKNISQIKDGKRVLNLQHNCSCWIEMGQRRDVVDALDTLRFSYLNDLPVDKHYRKIFHRQKKIFLACLLTRIYGEYSMMELNRSLSEYDQDYVEAEQSAGLFGAIFNMDIKPADLLKSKEDCCNEAIDHYDQMTAFLNAADISSLDRDSIMALCKSVEYGNKIFWLKFQANLNYKFHAEDILSFMTENISKEQFKSQFLEYSLFTKKGSPVNIKRLIRTMNEVNVWFNLICEKRNYRKNKKIVKYENN